MHPESVGAECGPAEEAPAAGSGSVPSEVGGAEGGGGESDVERPGDRERTGNPTWMTKASCLERGCVLC